LQTSRFFVVDFTFKSFFGVFYVTEIHLAANNLDTVKSSGNTQHVF